MIVEVNSFLLRWEASHIPKVKVAKIDNSKLKKEQSVYMPKIPDIEKCPPHLAPSKQWEDEFIADFSVLRLVRVFPLLSLPSYGRPVGSLVATGLSHR